MIVDDEPLAVKMLENYVGRTEGLTLVASFNDPVKALAALDEMQVDVLFLDIQMPDLDGLNLSRMVASTTRIIFTTAFKEYAFDSYEVNALDFLLKPIRYQKFLNAIEKARQWFDRPQQKQESEATSMDISRRRSHQITTFFTCSRIAAVGSIFQSFLLRSQAFQRFPNLCSQHINCKNR